MNVTLQPSLLVWVRTRAGLTEDVLAKKVGVSPDKVEQWETNGEVTYARIKKLAQVTRVPFGYFFLKEPPQEALPVADFRTVGSNDAETPSPELLDTLNDALSKQAWYHDHLIALGEGQIDYVSSISLDQPTTEIATRIRERFRFATNLRAAAKDWEEALKLMMEHCEDEGVIMLRAGIAKGNTHRPLLVSEFRGFALSDSHAPLVFINGKDSKAAQMFTLVHELVHLWLGVSGISNLEKTYSQHQEVEKFCNQVAAEVLVPTDELRERITVQQDDLAALKRHFKVSSLVLLRRLHDIDVLSKEEFVQQYLREEASFKKAGGSGGNYYDTHKFRVSPLFARALIGSTLEGRTLYRDAYHLLGIKKTKTFEEFARSLKFDL